MDELITTEKQIHALKQFKSLVAELQQDDETLARFLVARGFNIQKAEAMLRQNVNWRKENNVDNILNEFHEDSHIVKAFPFKITGFNESGSAIFWAPFGKYDGRSWLESKQGSYDELVRWGIYQMEYLRKTVMSKPKPQKVIVIHDMEGLTYFKAFHYQSLKCLHNVFQIMEQNYPEAVKSLVIINAPWIFYIPFNFIKTIFTTSTLSKLKIFDTNKQNWIECLKQLGPIESLPQLYFCE